MLDEEIKRQYILMRNSFYPKPILIKDEGNEKKKEKKKKINIDIPFRHNKDWTKEEYDILRKYKNRKISVLARHVGRTERMIIEKLREIKKYDKQSRNK